MVAESITDSGFFHASPISRDFSKKRKANWFLKLKQWKIDAGRKQWKRGNVSQVKSLRDKLTNGRVTPWSVFDDDYDDDDDDDSASSACSPTSVLKNKDSVSVDDDCFCCSNPFGEEDEEVFNDAFDDWECFSDALDVFEDEETVLKNKEDPNQRKKARNKEKKKKRSERKKQNQECGEGIDCPICSEPMDATDLDFSSCPCGYKLCLFCHNKINLSDGRCPACRNKYDPTRYNTQENRRRHSRS